MRTFLLVCLLSPLFLSAQLEWEVPPVIEDSIFFYHPESSGEIILTETQDKTQRLQRTDGSFLFPGQVFKRLQSYGASGVWSGLTPDEELIVFNRDAVVLSAGYDDLNAYYRTNILMTKKNNLFGLITADGEVVRQPVFENLRRKKRGLYFGEYPDGRTEDIEVEETDGLSDAQRASNLRIHSRQIKDRVMVKRKSGKRNYPYWGMTDTNGQEVLPADRYYSNYNKMLFEPQMMVAIDSKNDKEGVLDKDGKVLIPFIYDKVNYAVVNKQFFVAARADTSYLLSFDNQVKSYIVRKQLFRVGDHPLIMEKSGKQYRLVDLNLTPVLPDTFSYISAPFDKGGFLMLTKNKKTRFFLPATKRLSTKVFNKVNGSYALPPLAAREKQYFGLYDVYTDQYILPPTFDVLQRKGSWFRGVFIQRDTVRITGDSIVVQTAKLQQVFREDGQPVIGPTQHELSLLTEDIWMERINRDSMVLHNLASNQQRAFTKAQGTIKKDIIAFADGTFAFSADYLANDQPTFYDFLDNKARDHGLRRYKSEGKYGLLLDGVPICPPLYDYLDIRSINFGIKARLGTKWGVLAKPEGL